MNLRNKLLILSYCIGLLFPVICFSQKSDSTKTLSKNLFISGGWNYFSYYSGSFFSFLFNSTDFGNPVLVPVGSNYPMIIDSGSTSPNQYKYTKSSMGPSFNGGYSFNSGKLNNILLNHLITLEYSSVIEQFMGSVYYKEHNEGSTFNWIYINDTDKFKCNQSVLSLGYKFKPTYKSVFLLVGLNCSVNIVNLNLEKEEQKSYLTYDELNNMYYSSKLPITTSNENSNVVFVSFPLQIGMGANIVIQKFIVSPGLFLTSCFTKGYTIYNASIQLAYSIN